ncbi:hypothetical protein O181_124950 [Austropuccinia psidii MF-1]|uniref:Uncharacterized protein n=1 Tax=Austropuccinia psidii MF-1 TaxID=1389203 RepID=A0A9Q3KTZ4_9BASI|nr:hypothetical protein [Austropuccinia psidii MF-1]
MSYSEKEALKQLPEASSWPKFSGTGEYDHMELIDFIDGLFIDVPSIPDYWITARLNTPFKGHDSIWYTEMKESMAEETGHCGRVKSSKSTEMGKGCRSDQEEKFLSQLWLNRPLLQQLYKGKNKVYAIEKVPEEEFPTEDYESDSMGDAIREQSDEEKDPREEFLVEYQEETPLEIQYI